MKDLKITFKVATTSAETAEVHKIRRVVFVEEQRIPAHLDADGLDDSAVHVLCWLEGEVVATGRLVIPEPGSGILARIAVLPEFRGKGLGALVVKKLEEEAAERGLRQLTLHPHNYLEPFYQRLGYKTVPGASWAGEHELVTMCKNLGSSG